MVGGFFGMYDMDEVKIDVFVFGVVIDGDLRIVL